MSARILVVDDEPEVVKLVAYHLRKAGHSILTAGNGEDAVRRAQEAEPDLILLDLVLPDVEGFTVCETLRGLPATAAIPIVMLTGLPGEIPRCYGYECGATEYLHKPFDARELVERVEEVLAERKARVG
ncbi:MAG: response regulator [Verrucomicrobia bacterium]|nr:response regulator [Verrucomicrobiota bacterium]